MITKQDFERYLEVAMKEWEAKKEDMLISIYVINSIGDRVALVEEQFLLEVTDTALILYDYTLDDDNKIIENNKTNSRIIPLSVIGIMEIYA